MFVPVGCSEAVVASGVIEDVDPNEPAPLAVDPTAPLPENRRGFPIFAGDSVYSQDSGAVSVSGVSSGCTVETSVAL